MQCSENTCRLAVNVALNANTSYMYFKGSFYNCAVLLENICLKVEST